MPYKISGTKSETARIIIFKESDWSIESNTVISGSGNYEIDSLVSGTKLCLAHTENGLVEGYGNVSGKYYEPAYANRGVFFGGYGGSDTNVIEYITINTTSDAVDFGDLAVAHVYGAANSNSTNQRGIFAGGPSYANTIQYITISTPGNAQDFGDTTTNFSYRASTDNGTDDRAIWAGGYSITTVIDYKTISTLGNSSNFGNLTQARRAPMGTSNATNNRGVFACGRTGGSGTGVLTIDYITISSTGNATTFGNATIARYYCNQSACSNGTNNRGVFCGGNKNSGGSTNIIDYITISTTGDAADFGDLLANDWVVAATDNKVGNRGVIGGGNTGTYTNVIQYITISTLSNAIDFGDLTEAKNGCAATSNA